MKATLHWVSAAARAAGRGAPLRSAVHGRGSRARRGPALHRLPQPGLARSADRLPGRAEPGRLGCPSRTRSSSNGWATSVSIRIPRRGRSCSIAQSRCGIPGPKSSSGSSRVPDLILHCAALCQHSAIPGRRRPPSNTIARSCPWRAGRVSSSARASGAWKSALPPRSPRSIRGEFADARAALVELAELDPAHPELQAVTLQLARAEQASRPHLGAFAAAAAVFAAVILTASWAEKAVCPA